MTNCRAAFRQIIFSSLILTVHSAAFNSPLQAQTSPSQLRRDGLPQFESRGLDRVDTPNPAQANTIQSQSPARIVGGVPAREGDWPWQVAIKAKLGEAAEHRFICGGSIIGQRWVLTAAHCVHFNGKDAPAQAYLVVEGTQDVKDPSKGWTHAVTRIIRHEQYDGQKQTNDIALLELADPVHSTPVPYADAKTAALEAPGRTTTVTGWGRIRPVMTVQTASGQQAVVDAVTQQPLTQADIDKNYMPTQLMQLDLTVTAIERCQQAYAGSDLAKIVTVDNRVVCAAPPDGGKKDACQGDSGGPLVARSETGYVQVGVVSVGDPQCGLRQLPGVYTRVSAFEPWLRAKTSIDQQAPAPVSETQGAVDSLAGQNPAGVTVSFVQGRTVRIGQEAQFHVAARQSGYLVVFDATPDGRITQIYPNVFSMRSALGARAVANRLEAGRPLTVPDPSNPYSGFTFAVDPPTGPGRIIAILSDDPITELQITTQEAEKSQRQLKSFGSRARTLELLGFLSSRLRRDVGNVDRGQPHFSVAVADYVVTP